MKWDVFPYFFDYLYFSILCRADFVPLPPFSSFGTSALVLFSAKGFGNVFFSAGIYFYWMKPGQYWESKVSSPLTYIDGPEGGTCMFCTRVSVGICQTTRKGDFLRTLQRGWWVSTHPGHSYITLPYLPDSPDSNRTFCNNPYDPYVNCPSQRLLSPQNGTGDWEMSV